MYFNKPVDGKYTYTFTVSHAAESKATVGDKTGTQWPVLWSEGDQLGVYGGGEWLGVAAIDAASAGKNTGTFTLTTEAELSEGDELYFSYPYVEGAEMKTGKVAAEHTLTASGIGANGVAYAYVDYAGANTEFTLTHVNAYLKFNLLSSEDEDAFAGYDLQGVTLWAAGAELSGDVEVGDGDAVTYKGSGDYVKTTLATPVKMGTTAQSVFLSALPCDLSAKTVYAIVHMTKDKETVTLPVLLKGAGNLPAGSVTDVTLPSLTKSLAPAWYEPVETRYIAANGKGWCYGPENTVVFTPKTEIYGDTYRVDYTESAKDVELKARGNFMEVREPKYVKMEYLGDRYKKTDITSKVIIENTEISKDNIDTQIIPIGTYCSVNVNCKNVASVKAADNKFEGQMAAMLVLDAEKKPIWGINLWVTVQPIEEGLIQYEKGRIMNRNLGADNPPTINSWRTKGCFFQWGRPFAFPMGDKITPSSMSSSNVVSLAVSAENPYTLFYRKESGNDKWYQGEETIIDFWGNPNNASTANVAGPGHKSIYDPCPDGYMVASPELLTEVESAKNIEGALTYTANAGDLSYVTYNNVAWSYSGGYMCDSTTGINWKNMDRIAYWSNSNKGGKPTRGRALFLDGPYGTKTFSIGQDRAMLSAHSIRCMVDTENR